MYECEVSDQSDWGLRPWYIANRFLFWDRKVQNTKRVCQQIPLQSLRIICAASANVLTDFPMTSCGSIRTNVQKLIFMTKQGISLFSSLWDYYELWLWLTTQSRTQVHPQQNHNNEKQLCITFEVNPCVKQSSYLRIMLGWSDGNNWKIVRPK